MTARLPAGVEAQEALALWREIRDELRGLRADLAGRQQARVSSADHAILARLLPAVDAAVKGCTFNSAELLRHAELPDQVALRAVLSDIGGARRLGRLLRRADGALVADLQAVCVGADSGGLLFMVRKATDRHTG